jgi:hypothetical protein
MDCLVEPGWRAELMGCPVEPGSRAELMDCRAKPGLQVQDMEFQPLDMDRSLWTAGTI